jgi:hypothetical protein
LSLDRKEELAQREQELEEARQRLKIEKEKYQERKKQEAKAKDMIAGVAEFVPGTKLENPNYYDCGKKGCNNKNCVKPGSYFCDDCMFLMSIHIDKVKRMNF